MYIASDTETAIGWDGNTYTVTPGTKVCDVPKDCGTAILAMPVLGWRWATDIDWGQAPEPPADPIMTAASAAKPDTIEGRRAPDAEPAGTLADRVAASVRAAGPDGYTAKAAIDEHGPSAGNVLAALAKDGTIVRQGRGLYVHPDHAA